MGQTPAQTTFLIKTFIRLTAIYIVAERSLQAGIKPLTLQNTTTQGG